MDKGEAASVFIKCNECNQKPATIRCFDCSIKGNQGICKFCYTCDSRIHIQSSNKAIHKKEIIPYHEMYQNRQVGNMSKNSPPRLKINTYENYSNNPVSKQGENRPSAQKNSVMVTEPSVGSSGFQMNSDRFNKNLQTETREAQIPLSKSQNIKEQQQGVSNDRIYKPSDQQKVSFKQIKGAQKDAVMSKFEEINRKLTPTKQLPSDSTKLIQKSNNSGQSSRVSSMYPDSQGASQQQFVIKGGERQQLNIATESTYSALDQRIQPMTTQYKQQLSSGSDDNGFFEFKYKLKIQELESSINTLRRQNDNEVQQHEIQIKKLREDLRCSRDEALKQIQRMNDEFNVERGKYDETINQLKQLYEEEVKKQQEKEEEMTKLDEQYRKQVEELEEQKQEIGKAYEDKLQEFEVLLKESNDKVLELQRSYLDDPLIKLLNENPDLINFFKESLEKQKEIQSEENVNEKEGQEEEQDGESVDINENDSKNQQNKMNSNNSNNQRKLSSESYQISQILEAKEQMINELTENNQIKDLEIQKMDELIQNLKKLYEQLMEEKDQLQQENYELRIQLEQFTQYLPQNQNQIENDIENDEEGQKQMQLQQQNEGDAQQLDKDGQNIDDKKNKDKVRQLVQQQLMNAYMEQQQKENMGINDNDDDFERFNQEVEEEVDDEEANKDLQQKGENNQQDDGNNDQAEQEDN